MEEGREEAGCSWPSVSPQPISSSDDQGTLTNHTMCTHRDEKQAVIHRYSMSACASCPRHCLGLSVDGRSETTPHPHNFLYRCLHQLPWASVRSSRNRSCTCTQTTPAHHPPPKDSG